MAAKQQKRVSSKDVAREAGVSQSTVSRVYNDSGIPVNPDTREKILAAADKLGYLPSLIARSLNSQSTRIIGIVMKRFDSVFYMNVLGQFTQQLQAAGYSVMIFNFDNEKDVEENLRTALEYQVAGVVITSAMLSSPLVEGFLRFGSPVFLFNRISEGLNVNTICSDNFGGGEMAAEYLIKRGHRKLVYIAGEADSSTNRDRKKGFMNGAAEFGIKDIPVIRGDFSYQSGFDAAEKIFNSGIEVDAIFCAADDMAMGAMDFFRYKTDLKIPRDISLMGFDGIPLENTITYPITTVKQPVDRMVEKTVQLLVQMIESGSHDVIHHLFPDRILERNSVADRVY